MKLFFREQVPLLFIYFIQLLVVNLVYWLDGFDDLRISLYAALLSTCILIGYFLFRYLTNRNFYQRLARPMNKMDDFAEKVQQSPLAEGLQELLHSQFRLYRNDLHTYKHRLELHTQFINQWVHQMKTPLSVIHLTIQDEDDPRFDAIADELDRLKKGLELVLYTARLDTFERDFYVETIDVEKVVRSVTSAQKRLFIRSRVFPVIQIEGEITVSSDEKWLSFIITQLITNSVRYTVQENKKIYFRGYTRGIHKVLEVVDEGVGIPQSDRKRVFDPYFTGGNGRNFQESTGMGLYLVNQICEKLGHRIELDSEVGKGTTVRLIFS